MVTALITYVHELVHAIIIGVPSYLLIHGTIKVIKWTLLGNERSKAIVEHYRAQSKGLGHQVRRVEKCVEGRCALIGSN